MKVKMEKQKSSLTGHIEDKRRRSRLCVNWNICKWMEENEFS